MDVTVNLCGPLRVMDRNGGDITPRSAKARGMIALLCTSNNFVRSRTWLQAHLWSDRAREQSAGSLRQALTEMRKTFGDLADIIITDRQDVQLSTARVTLDADDPTREFLEGIDVKDAQFEEWLRVERSRRAAPNDPRLAAPSSFVSARPTPDVAKLVLLNDSSLDGMEAFFSAFFADSVAKNLDELINVSILPDNQTSTGRNDLVLRTSASFETGLAGLRVSMERATTRQRLWSGAELIQTDNGPPVEDERLFRLVNQACEGICEALLSGASRNLEGWDMAVTERRAIRLIFGMNAEDQQIADGLLEHVFSIQPRATHLSWRAMLRLIMLIEAHEGLSGDLASEAVMFAHKAVEMEPLNSLVLSAAANVALVLEEDNVRGLEFAERAVRINPANPFAYDALSIAALYHGSIDKARSAQERARYVAGKTQFAHWFDMGCSKLSAITGDFGTAKSMALRSAAGAPNFRPPLRYLIVLYLHSGEIEKALATVERLKRIEPFFEVDKLWGDDAYPVRDLRRSKLLNKEARSILN